MKSRRNELSMSVFKNIELGVPKYSQIYTLCSRTKIILKNDQIIESHVIKNMRFYWNRTNFSYVSVKTINVL